MEKRKQKYLKFLGENKNKMLSQSEINRAQEIGRNNKNYLSNNDIEGLFNSISENEMRIFTAYVFEKNRGNIIMKHLSKLYRSMFSKCDLDTLIIPKNIQYLEDGCFDCIGVKHIIFENSNLRLLPKYAFGNNLTKCLESVDLPNGLKVLPAYCFDECKNLKEVFLPDSLELIGKGAFNGCDKVQLIANFRKDKKIKAPKEDFEFFKKHLVFNHPEQEEDE